MTADADPQPLKHSPLEGEHEELGGRLVPFGGWSMPVRYPEGTIAEHMAVRQSAGIFDVSHLGSVRVSGDGATLMLNALFTNDLNRIEPGQAQYTLLLNEDGGVVDDIIVWWLDDDDFWVIPNASNTEAVVAALNGASGGGEPSVTDLSEEMAIIAVQGPRWKEVLSDAGLSDLIVGRFKVVAGNGVTAAGTGYTGEGGCELLVPTAESVELWRGLVPAVRSVGGLVAGLGARDTLRLEMGYPLHGHEMDSTVSPYEAGLGWVVSAEKSEFAGRGGLSGGPGAAARELIGFEMSGREIPRADCLVLDSVGEAGIVTSGNASPVLGHGVGLARVERGRLAEGDAIEIDIRGRMAKATVSSPPFVKR